MTLKDRRIYRQSVKAFLASIVIATTGLTVSGASTTWTLPLHSGSNGEASSRVAITTATSNPVTFSAACVSSSAESAVLTWTSAGSAVTGYEVLVGATVSGTFAVATTQPSGTALTVTETYTSSTGKKFFRLEAKSTNWVFPGTTITNAREAAVGGTNGGYLTIASSGTECAATT